MINLIIFLTLTGTGVAAIWDLKTHKIPNRITFPLLILGLILHFTYGGIEGLKDSLLGLTLITLVLLLPFVMGGIGAGDVKLLAAIGALNGLWFGIYTLLYSSLIGGLIALILAAFRGQLGLTVFNLSSSLVSVRMNVLKGKLPDSNSIITTGITFPYGIAIFMGVAVTYVLR